jgi:hypothetical protein
MLYLAMKSTTTINNALVSLFLLAVFSTAYDILRLYVGRSTRQNRNYAIIDGTPEASTSVLLSSLPRISRGLYSTDYVKALFHAFLFVGVQYATTQAVTQLARAIASTFTTDSYVRRECDHLLAKGLECSAVLRYHDFLNIAAVMGLLCLIRGLDLHADLPFRNRNNRNYSTDSLSLQAKFRSAARIILATPINVVYMHARVTRQDLWKHARMLLTQAAMSLGIFVVGNFVCLIAALPVCPRI